VTPCPYNDFNGAGLLYFASFQALADRAHGHWGLHATERAAQGVVRERQMVFHGNVNPGEALRFGCARCATPAWATGAGPRCSARAGRCVADLATLRV
jgi:probable biosynthetic protein (TIGR04098 family)